MKLNLPDYELKTEKRDGKLYVFDPFRRKYVAFTPEEYVRQMFLQYLISEKKYPKSLLAVEVSLTLHKLSKRADIVLYDTEGNAKVLVECKAPNVEITQKTFDQIVRYNMVYQSDYLIVTNGMKHYCAKMDYSKNDYRFLPDIPPAENL